MVNKVKPTIIWDWNGTLINDVQICIQAMNSLLVDRNLAQLTPERYKEIFTFPVRNYYLEAGFDFSKEPFEKPAIEFIDAYKTLLPKVGLFGSVKHVLQQVKDFGFNQVIVSAMEEESLIKSVKDLGILSFFDAIAGITDHFANGKTQRGQQLIKEYGLNPSKMVFVGDTLHDKEVADELGCACVLVSGGHQSHSRLAVNGNLVANNLEEALIMVEQLLPVN